MKSLVTVFISLLAGFVGGFAGSGWQTDHSAKVVRVHSIELTDEQGRVAATLGPVEQRGFALRFFDSNHQMRAEIGSNESSSSVELTSSNGRYKSILRSMDAWPDFMMLENGHARIGMGLLPDDTLSTAQEDWAFYTGVGGINGARAVLGSGRVQIQGRDMVRGNLSLCCKGENFWSAPPK
jgi:hypothetical protein